MRSPKPDSLPARILSRTYPKAAERLEHRYETYNRELKEAYQYEKEGSLLLLAPDELCGLNTLTRNAEGLDRMYRKGYANAAAIPAFLAS